MFYRYRRKLQVRKFDYAIRKILETPPVASGEMPWTVVSMVADRDVPMYLLALKSFVRAVGRGKVVAIIDRDMPQASRNVLRDHVKGIEFIILEDIKTGECQRGGTWERILHIVDRTETEYVIQLDSDILTVSDRLEEVIFCCKHNIPFTMADGFFSLQPMLEAAQVAQATPSDYVGIVTERAFEKFPGADRLHYIRGSSGFAGFCKGGVTRHELTMFHRELSALVGERRFREWGTEQCASNFVVANSPNPLVLPYPEYASFGRPIPLNQVKLFHFIGATRFRGGYYVARAKEIINKLCQDSPHRSAGSVLIPKQKLFAKPPPGSLVAAIAPECVPKYLAWKAFGRKVALTLNLRCKIRFELRGSEDLYEALEIYGKGSLNPPVWLPPERIKLVVDCGVGVGFSALYWLANYPEARIVAYEPRTDFRRQLERNVAMNKGERRIEITGGAAIGDILTNFAGQPIDILRLNGETSGFDLLDDERFQGLVVKAIVLTLRRATGGFEEKIIARLKFLGFRLQPPMIYESSAVLWGFRATFPDMRAT